MKKYLITCCLVVYSASVYAQTVTQCGRALAQVEIAFNQGRLSDIITTYDNENSDFTQCLVSNNLTIEDRIKGYKLVIKAYLFQDDKEKAEEMFVRLLKLDKEHQLAPTDPAELYLLKDKYVLEPIFRVSAKMSLNKSLPTIIQSFNTFQIGDKKYNEQGNEVGLGIGFSGEVLIEKHLVAGIEVVGGMKYKNTIYEVEGDLIGSDLNYVITNTSAALSFPVLLRYNFNYNRKDRNGNKVGFIPYIYVGASYDLLLSAKYKEARRTGGTAYTLPDSDVDLLALKQTAISNITILGGVGVRFRVGRARVNFISVEARYENQLFNYINPNNRWENKNLTFGVGHIEDDLTLNTISLGVGYTYSLYLPRKRKNKR